MEEILLNHYLDTGTYTYAGAYKDYFISLPSEIADLGRLICMQVIHRVTLKQGNTNANQDLRYGDMNQFPWHRMRCEDDVLLTAPAMTAELFRLDHKGFTFERKVENKLVVTCRYVSVLMSAILKAKGIPCRSRSGFAPYIIKGSSLDHWVNQCWDKKAMRWVTFDADGLLDAEKIGFDQYDIPEDRFDWAADTWLKIRKGMVDGNQFKYAGGLDNLQAVIRAVFYDFHALMNHEISYLFQPAYIDGKFDDLSAEEMCEIDMLCEAMCFPDEHYKQLHEIWDNRRKFRILNSPLVSQ